jgi:hypothetical protein
MTSTRAIFTIALDDKLRPMGRGLGERQRRVLEHLAGCGEQWEPLYRLADDPDDPNEMAKARSAVRGLERRGLVEVASMPDHEYDRRVPTSVVRAEVGTDWDMTYRDEPTTRLWSGMHVRLLGPEDKSRRAEWLVGLSRVLDEQTP